MRSTDHVIPLELFFFGGPSLRSQLCDVWTSGWVIYSPRGRTLQRTSPSRKTTLTRPARRISAPARGPANSPFRPRTGTPVPTDRSEERSPLLVNASPLRGHYLRATRPAILRGAPARGGTPAMNSIPHNRQGPPRPRRPAPPAHRREPSPPQNREGRPRPTPSPAPPQSSGCLPRNRV